MTSELCTSTCASKGFTMAGVEFGSECYCGNSISNGLGQQLDADRACYMTCSGNGGEHCGGTWTLSLFKLGDSVTKRARHFGRQHRYHSHSF
jgi:hypothetical protein